MPLNPIAQDDQLQPGETYTFSLQLKNLLLLPSESTIQNDIANFGPSYASNLIVHSGAGASPYSSYMNITFTYTGDGSDVVSDVGAEMVAAVKQGSSDNYVFVNAFVGTTGLSATVILGDAVYQAQKAINPLLPSSGALWALVAIGVLVIFVASGGIGVARSVAS